MTLMVVLLVSQIINILGPWCLCNLVVLEQYDFIANRLSSLRRAASEKPQQERRLKLQTGWVRLGLDMRGLS